MKWTETVILLTIQLALAVASLVFTDSHKTGPEPEKGEARRWVEGSVGLQIEQILPFLSLPFPRKIGLLAPWLPQINPAALQIQLDPLSQHRPKLM